jgi:membrane protein implicated in regulation of membrane protease activity
MPPHIFAALIISVIAAAGLTVWGAVSFGPVIGLATLSIIAVLAVVLLWRLR